MDTVTRIKPADASTIITVDRSVMGLCKSSVLVNSVVVRHLPANVGELTCAITVSVNGSSFTMPAIKADAELQEVDEVTGTVSLLTLDGSEVSSHGAKHGLFKLRYTNLNLLFPGTRMRAREMGVVAKAGIADPRHFPLGVQVTVHSADHNYVFGSTLCTFSGEAMTLSYPRGEAIVNFRVYPVISGEAEMSLLYNKSSFVSTYFGPNAAPQAPAIAAHSIAADAATEADGEGGINAAGEAAADEEEAAAPDSGSAEVPVDEQSEEEAAQQVEEDEAMVAEPEAELPSTPADSEAVGSAHGETAVVALQAPKAEDEKDQEVERAVAVVSARTPIDWLPIVQIPCFTEQQRRAAFSSFDKEGKGYLTHAELLAFCKFDCAYADVWATDDQMLRSLVPQIREDQHVSYELFSYVCFKLARS